MPRPASKSPSLWPKEHGAYFQLLLPQLTALGLGWPTAAALLLTTATILAFLGHEPLLIALGHRGPRVTRELGPAARPRAAVLLTAAVLAGVAGLYLGGETVIYAAVVPLLASLFVGGFIVRKQEKTVPGELAVGVAFASAAAPVAIAVGASPSIAATAAGIWALGFATATLAVHAVVATVKGNRPLARPLAILAALACVGAAAMPVLAATAPVALYALALSGIAGLGLVFAKVHPRHMRRVGWTLAATHGATLIALVVALRIT